MALTLTGGLVPSDFLASLIIFNACWSEKYKKSLDKSYLLEYNEYES